MITSQREELKLEKRNPRSPATVLVVEDDEGLNRLIQRRLQREGFRTEGVFDGFDAIARAVEKPDTLLLLDYVLPTMTGEDVIEQLAERQCSVPFIVMTGHGDENVAVEMMKLGARDYIVKNPGFIGMLPKAVRRVYEELETEKRLARAEQALRESEEKYRSLIENSPDYIIIVDRESTVEFVNRPTPGLVMEDVIGRSVYDYIEPGSQDRHREVLAQVFETGKANALESTVGVGGDGSLVCYETRFVPIKRGENVSSVMLIVTDTTDRKHMEKQLVSQAKLASIGQLAAGIAHELNNSLTPVLSLSDLLTVKLADRLKEQERKHLAVIKKSALRMGKIIDDLITFSGSGKLEKGGPVDLNDIIDKALELVESQIKAEGILVQKHNSPLPPFPGDADGLMEIFINLFLNSKDALAGNREKKIWIKTEYLSEERSIRIKFRDNGEGIKKEILQRVFDPFFTTKQNGKETGLGLSIVYGIVEDHGGSIQAESNGGGHTEFVLLFPQDERSSCPI
ncbi:MAG: ATP-binding protein [bacterium]